MKLGSLLILVFACGAFVPLNAADMEQASPIVQACVDKDGKLVSAEIFESSGFPELDAAALKIARASKFTPGTDNYKKKMKLSCVKFKVKFVIRDGEPEPAEG